jgi:hypothetical protein
MTEPIKVILVHGTFDIGAEWTRDGSQYRQLLSAKVEQENRKVEFQEHHWDGENTYVSRLNAAKRLDEELIDINKKFDGDTFVIGHSHGGNIIRKALDILPQTAQPTAVITYGTPFIQFRDRELDLFVFCVRILISIIGISICFWLFSLSFYLADMLPNTNGYAIFAIIIVFLGGAVSLGAFYFLLVKISGGIIFRLKDKITRSRISLRNDYSSLDVSLTSFVCFHVAGDEVSILLRVWIAVTSLLNGFLRFLEVSILLPIFLAIFI